jgi:hypothetical protein
VLDELFEQAGKLAQLLQKEVGSVPTPIAQVIDNVVEPDFGRNKS